MGGELEGPVNNQYPYPVGSNTHLLKKQIYVGTTEFSNDGFDKAFGLVHKIKYIILFANSKLNIFINKYIYIYGFKYRYRFRFRFRFGYRYRYNTYTKQS
jgi:hypothetical protein